MAKKKEEVGDGYRSKSFADIDLELVGRYATMFKDVGDVLGDENPLEVILGLVMSLSLACRNMKMNLCGNTPCDAIEYLVLSRLSRVSRPADDDDTRPLNFKAYIDLSSFDDTKHYDYE